MRKLIHFLVQWRVKFLLKAAVTIPLSREFVSVNWVLQIYFRLWPQDCGQIDSYCIHMYLFDRFKPSDTTSPRLAAGFFSDFWSSLRYLPASCGEKQVIWIKSNSQIRALFSNCRSKAYVYCFRNELKKEDFYQLTMDVKGVRNFPVISVINLTTSPLTRQTKFNLEQNGWKIVCLGWQCCRRGVGGGRIQGWTQSRTKNCYREQSPTLNVQSVTITWKSLSTV